MIERDFQFVDALAFFKSRSGSNGPWSDELLSRNEFRFNQQMKNLDTKMIASLAARFTHSR
jgi:hypothetical protein